MTDGKINSVGDLIRALDVRGIRDLEIKSVTLASHPDGTPRRLVVSFKGLWEQEHPVEL
jgi:hypothetical protein